MIDLTEQLKNRIDLKKTKQQTSNISLILGLTLPSSKNGKLGIFTSYGSGDCGGVENTSKSGDTMVKELN